MTDKLCEYCQTKIAKYIMSNGRLCCESYYTKCPSTKRKNSESHKGEKHPLWGKKHSAETKQKMRKAKLGSKHSPETKQKMSETHRNVTALLS
jgi:hypothetical protein